MKWPDILTPLSSSVNTNTVLVLLLTILMLLVLLPRKSVPGPSIWQLLPGGEIYPFLRDSHETSRAFFSLQQKYGHVYALWLGPNHTIITADAEDVTQVLASSDFRRSRAITATFGAVVPGALFTTVDVGAHARARKKLKGSFNFSIVENCHSYLTDAIKELCSTLQVKATHHEGRNPFDIASLLSGVTFRVILNIAFGCEVSKERREAAYDAAEIVIDEMTKDLLTYPIRHALTPLGVRNALFESREELYEIGRELVRSRAEEAPEEKAARPTDALDAIISLTTDDQKILSMSIELAIAGSHTTSQSVAWCIYELCCNPDVEKKVLEAVDKLDKPLTEWLSIEETKGLDYLHKVWKEANRMHAPAAFILREASVPTTLRGSGIEVKKGKYVIAFLHGIHNRADLWNSPEKFKPGRWDTGGEGESVPPGAYMPFGIGTMGCIGRFLADYEGVLILAELYRRFRFRLGCKPEEIVSVSTIVESPRCINESVDGFPVHVQLR